MTVRIEAVDADRHRDAIVGITTALGFVRTPEALQQLAGLSEWELRFCAYDGADAVGGMLSFAFEMSVPGGMVRTSGLSGVGVVPTHRRRGLLTQMMQAYVRELRSRGVPSSSLWAAEGGIYRRFGYGPASFGYAIKAHRGQRGFVSSAPSGFALRRVSEEVALQLFPEVYRRAGANRPGMMSRSLPWWKVRRVGEPLQKPAGGELQRVVAERNGVAEGYALYRIEAKFDQFIIGGTVKVLECVATNAVAERALWQHLFDVDLMDTVEASHLPPDHVLFTGAIEARRLRATMGDELWLRLLDVESMLQQRRYSADTSVCFSVRDTFAPWNEGTYRVEPGAKSVACRTEEAPAFTLDVSVLGSAYLGGLTFTQLADAGLLQVHDEHALLRATQLFQSLRAPWCPEVF